MPANPLSHCTLGTTGLPLLAARDLTQHLPPAPSCTLTALPGTWVRRLPSPPRAAQRVAVAESAVGLGPGSVASGEGCWPAVCQPGDRQHWPGRFNESGQCQRQPCSPASPSFPLLTGGCRKPASPRPFLLDKPKRATVLLETRPRGLAPASSVCGE